MAKKDIFQKPFDDGTIDKLQIFEDYFKEWLPVFISRREIIWKQIQIFDLFAGEGKDITGVSGSPLRLLSVLNQNRALILASQVRIKVILNEFEFEKYNQLVKYCEEVTDKNIYDVEIYNDDFSMVFDRKFDSMKSSANFLFLDQNGIKQITENIFQKLISLKQTDFIFFISSSYIKRFSEVDEFQKYLKITKQDLEGKSYYHIHRIVLNYYRSLIPLLKPYFLAPFSIKKPTGIYGLIFGTNHTLGIEKFLNVCWKHDQIRGEANFDIDNEKIDLNQPSIFKEYNIPSKKQVFINGLKEKILSRELKTGRDVYLFTLNEGFLMKDANIILKELEKEGKILYNFKIANSNLHKLETVTPIKVK